MPDHGNNCIPAPDAYSPREMACKARTIGVQKARLDFLSTLILAVLAGAFIALGACFYTTVATGSPGWYGLGKLVAGLSFCLGLILVVVAGAELFTGNVLIVMAFMSRQVSLWMLARNWIIVYVGNFVGSLAVAALVYYSLQWKAGDMQVGVTACNIAGKKMSLPFGAAFSSGVLCNLLVCLAVWLCYSARSTTDKIISIVFPITAFVALGFEHSVANMYLIPYAIALVKTPEFICASASHLQYSAASYTAGRFLLSNLLPVTLGNIVGGGLLVGAVYWLVFLRVDQNAQGGSSDLMTGASEQR